MAFRDNPIIFLSAKVWKYSKGNRHNVILYLLLFIIANLIVFLEPLVVGKLLNIIQEMGITSESFPLLIKVSLLFIILEIGFWIFHGPARVMEKKNAFLVRANYKKYLIEGTLMLPSEWHTDHHSGDTIDKIDKSTTALYTYSGRTFEVVETLIRFISSYIALIYFNLSSSYIVFFMVVLAIMTVLKFDNYLSKQYKTLFSIENRISAKIFDVISNITTVIILRIEKLLSRSIFRKIMSPYKLYLKNIKVNELKWALVSLCTALMTFAVIVTYIYSNYIAGTAILIGTLYVLYGYVQRISGLFFRFAYRYGDIVRQKSAVENVQEVSDKFRSRQSIKNIILDKKWKKIGIDNLNFSYIDEKKGELNLKDVSFLIRRGENIALIGESGGGKSTILKVMRGLYNPNGVNVYLDGKRLKKGFDEISCNITLIPQDPEIFNTTVRKNITFGMNYSIAHIRRFTDMARFTNVFENLPKGLESSIVEKGVNLSGGEKQRMALSRGLLASENKQIVFLDEPTSSVDTKNELEIYANILREFRHKTIISSIHRLHLLMLFDRIYLFRGGKVIAHGTFSELMDNSYEFRKMWRRYSGAMSRKKK